jgi:hypothetical protein
MQYFAVSTKHEASILLQPTFKRKTCGPIKLRCWRCTLKHAATKALKDQHVDTKWNQRLSICLVQGLLVNTAFVLSYADAVHGWRMLFGKLVMILQTRDGTRGDIFQLFLPFSAGRFFRIEAVHRGPVVHLVWQSVVSGRCCCCCCKTARAIYAAAAATASRHRATIIKSELEA